MSDDLQFYRTALHWSFWGSFGGFMTSLLFFMGAEAGTWQREVSLGMFPIALIASLCFYIFLGSLATRLHRSWIIWVGLSILTAPMGPIVAYAWMVQLVSAKLRETP